MRELFFLFSSHHGPSQASTGHGKPKRGGVIPDMSHPDESDVSRLFCQAVGFFITETVLFFLQPDLEALCMLKRRLYCAAAVRQTPGRATPASGRMERSETICEATADLWKWPEI